MPAAARNVHAPPPIRFAIKNPAVQRMEPFEKPSYLEPIKGVILGQDVRVVLSGQTTVTGTATEINGDIVTVNTRLGPNVKVYAHISHVLFGHDALVAGLPLPEEYAKDFIFTAKGQYFHGTAGENLAKIKALGGLVPRAGIVFAEGEYAGADAGRGEFAMPSRQAYVSHFQKMATATQELSWTTTQYDFAEIMEDTAQMEQLREPLKKKKEVVHSCVEMAFHGMLGDVGEFVFVTNDYSQACLYAKRAEDKGKVPVVLRFNLDNVRLYKDICSGALMSREMVPSSKIEVLFLNNPQATWVKLSEL